MKNMKCTLVPSDPAIGLKPAAPINYLYHSPRHLEIPKRGAFKRNFQQRLPSVYHTREAGDVELRRSGEEERVKGFRTYGVFVLLLFLRAQRRYTELEVGLTRLQREK